jgi:hypothetical protein
MCTLHEDVFTFMTISLWILLRMRNVSNIICRENQNTRFMFSNFFRKSCLLWNDVGKNGGAWDTTDDNMAHAPCMLDKQGYIHASTRPCPCAHPPPPTHTHITHMCKHIQKYAILTVFPQQQWFLVCASVLRYTNIACLVFSCWKFLI